MHLTAWIAYMRELDKEKIRALIKKIDDGKNVSKRDLLNTLGKIGLEQYEEMWEFEQSTRLTNEEKPEEIKKYEEMLKAADFAANRASAINGEKSNQAKAKSNNKLSGKERLSDKSLSLYEDALEYLQEIVYENRALEVWFDRALIFGTEGTISIDAIGMPRTITSRSNNRQASITGRNKTKSEVKREILEQALAESDEKVEIDSEKLKSMLKKLKGY